MTRRPRFLAASSSVDEAITAISRACANLRSEGTDKQHPLFYRANQFWRQLDEFRTELDRTGRTAALSGRSVEP